MNNFKSTLSDKQQLELKCFSGRLISGIYLSKKSLLPKSAKLWDCQYTADFNYSIDIYRTDSGKRYVCLTALLF